MIVQRLHHEPSPPLSAMIVDADGTSVRLLKAALGDDRRIAVGCTARTITAAIEQAAEHNPDVVFLDVAIADGDGIAMARQLAPGRAIVVVSDRPDFAFSAYEFGAIDYLLKPVSVDRLRVTMRRIDRFFSCTNDLTADAGTPSLLDRLASTDRVQIPARAAGQRKTTDLVPVADVVWVESLQNYSIVQLPGRDRRSVKRTLIEWATLLPAGEFVRIGRSHLIQLARLQTITSPARNEWMAHFRDVSQPLRLGRAAASKLKAILRGPCPA